MWENTISVEKHELFIELDAKKHELRNPEEDSKVLQESRIGT